MHAVTNTKYLREILSPDYLDLIKGKMFHRGCSQRDIARAIKVPPNNVCAVLKGTRFTYGLFEKIINYLEIPIIDLIKEESKKGWLYAIESTTRKPGVASVSKE